MDSRPHPAELSAPAIEAHRPDPRLPSSHPPLSRHHSNSGHDPYEIHASAAYISSSSQFPTTPLFPDDGYRQYPRPPQLQHQPQFQLHYRQYLDGQHPLDRPDMDLDDGPPSEQYPPHVTKSSLYRQSSSWATQGHNPKTQLSSSALGHSSNGPSSTPRGGHPYVGQAQEDTGRPFPPASSLLLHAHGSSPRHSSYPFTSPSTSSAGVALVDRERERERELERDQEKERKRERVSEPGYACSGGQSSLVHHPEEPLRTLSSLAYQHQHQQQQQQQQQEAAQSSIHSAIFPQTMAPPDDGYAAGPQDRAAEVKDSANLDVVNRALDHPSTITSFHQHEDQRRLHSLSHSAQHPYRSHLAHGQSYRGHRYEDIPPKYEGEYDLDQQNPQRVYSPQQQSDYQHHSPLHLSIPVDPKYEPRPFHHPQQQRPSTLRHSSSYSHEHHSSASPVSYSPPSSHYPDSPSFSASQTQLQHQQPAQPYQPGQQGNARRASAPRVPSKSIMSSLPSLSRREPTDRTGDGSHSTTHDSSYDSNAEEDEDMSPFNIKTHDPRFKFGTDMPNTVDLKAAIESCDILCKFALHYTEQANTVHDDRRSSELDPEMRANLQKIRYMNTTMLMGLQHVIKTNEKVADDGGELSPSQSNATSQERIERETSPVRFSNGVPPNELVHELAKVATSIFQLAIRIKAWVGMTPRERELDEEINTIRGKRCVLLDSTLAPSVVDQHGNVQKDWTVVPATSSTSKSYYERQRDLVQPRPSHNYPLNQRHRQQQQPFERYDQPRPAINRDLHRSQMEVDHEGRPFMKHGNSSSAMASLSTSHRGHSFKEGFSTSYSSDSGMSRVGYRHSNSSVTSVDGYSKNNSTEGGRNSKSGEAPYQKYRKRAKRTQPPGRCLSCDSSDTPEWRRGPDGARTLCNACGLHYAKLLKRQSEQGQLAAGPTSLKSRVINTRMEQLQAIALPLRKRNSSQTAESTPHADPSGSDTATPIATATGELLGPSGVGSPGIGSSGVRSSGAGPSEAGSSQAESLGVGASEIGSSGSESSSVQTEASSAPSSVGESDSYQLSESKKMADQDAAAVAVSSTENGVVDKELKKEG